MGCDIHTYIEVRDRKTMKWEHKKTPVLIAKAKIENDEDFLYECDIKVWRDYYLFGILADVRTKQPKGGIAPRGVPDDLSEFIQAANDNYGVDGHSHSYLYLDEFVSIDTQLRLARNVLDAATKQMADNINKYLAGNNLSDIPPGNIRVVFWFDN